MSGTPKGKFPKSSHLLKHADFQRVYQQGKRHFSGNMTVFFLRNQPAPATSPNGEAEAGCAQPGGAFPKVRVGFTVSKAVGKSVERNRIRRRTREAVRFHFAMLAPLTEPVDIVFNPKRSALTTDFAGLSAEVERAFRVVLDKGGASARPRAPREKRQARR